MRGSKQKRMKTRKTVVKKAARKKPAAASERRAQPTRASALRKGAHAARLASAPRPADVATTGEPIREVTNHAGLSPTVSADDVDANWQRAQGAWR
jgi:hypothetical protein